MNIDKMTNKLQMTLNKAVELCLENNNPELTISHILKVMINDHDLKTFIQQFNIDLNNVNEVIDENLKKLPSINGDYQPTLSRDVIEAYSKATKLLKDFGDEYLSNGLFLIAMFETSDSIIKAIKTTYNITDEQLKDYEEKRRGGIKMNDQSKESQLEALEKYGRDLTQEVKDGKVDPVIGRDEEIRRVIEILSRKTKNNPVLIGDPGVGKTAIVEGLAWRIFNNDVPFGLQNKRVIELDLGALIAGASYRGEFEDRLKGVLDQIKQSDGEIILFIDEIHQLVGAGKTDGAMDAANLLKPMLARGELRTIGATTFNEYRQYIEKDSALERRFQKVQVNEPSVEDTIAILRGLKDRFEQHHGVKIKDEAIIAATTLSNRYITDRFLPDKAIDLIDEACATIRVEMDSMPVEIDELQRKIRKLEIELSALKKEKDEKAKTRKENIKSELANLKEQETNLMAQWNLEKEQLDSVKDAKIELDKQKLLFNQAQIDGEYEKAAKIQYQTIPELEKKIKENEAKINQDDEERLITEVVTDEEIAKIVSRWTHIDVSKLMSTEREKLLQLDQVLAKRVIGQSEALDLVTNAILRSKAQIQDESKPIGSFLFLGPTGVGKTEVAKALAEQLFDDENKIIRIDMSEYMEKHAVSRLVGAPPGYIGYEEGGQLTEAVRRNPYSIILLDEIEKAHPDVFNILLQILDDGRVTDSKGVTVDFKNTLIIMTSNLGSEYAFEEDKEAKTQAYENTINSYFKPEFINRIDEIIIFNPLNEEVLSKIAEKFLNELRTRLDKNDITLEVEQSAMDKIIELGLDPTYGARPMKRHIQREIETLLAKEIIKDESKGAKTFILSYQDNQYKITKK